VRLGRRGGCSILGTTCGARCKSMTACRSGPSGSKLLAVDTAVQAGTKEDDLLVRALGACQHEPHVDVEIPGGRW
jgi:hypothetical protein